MGSSDRDDSFGATRSAVNDETDTIPRLETFESAPAATALGHRRGPDHEANGVRPPAFLDVEDRRLLSDDGPGNRDECRPVRNHLGGTIAIRNGIIIAPAEDHGTRHADEPDNRDDGREIPQLSPNQEP
jgi:hypothetical protein